VHILLDPFRESAYTCKKKRRKDLKFIFTQNDFFTCLHSLPGLEMGWAWQPHLKANELLTHLIWVHNDENISVLVKTYVKPYFRTEPHKLGFLPQNEFFHLCHHISKTHCLHLPRKSCLTNKYMVFPGAVYWTSEWLILDQWIGLASVNPSRNLSVIDFVQESSDYT
jgi:hypothetical protein